MDLDEIKGIIKADGGKFIIVENNKPSLVVISFDEYRKYLQKIETGQDGQSPSLFQNAKQDSNDKKSEEKVEDLSSVAPAGAKEDELTIDDLPL